MPAHALTLARIALILALNGLTALGAGDALSQGHEVPVPMVDPSSLVARPALQTSVAMPA